MVYHPKKLLLLGSGELGKEVTIAAKRLGCQVIACDRYENAPAMQVADIFEIFDMNNRNKLREIILKHRPDHVIPEIEALEVNTLLDLEKEGFNITPTARATAITMNRDKIRNLASNELNIKTAKFKYASSLEEVHAEYKDIGFPFIMKPIMSSSGKGQSLIAKIDDIDNAWSQAIKESRGNSSKVIMEEFIDFDIEITLLTIKQRNKPTLFCPPIGHQQINGDYQSSWQPALIKNEHLKLAQEMAQSITNNLGGEGLFGVEFFISNDEVIFSELSPRPHDTGLVTLKSQNINEFELHLHAILGLPIPEIKQSSIGATRVILANETITNNVGYLGLDEALEEENTNIMIFGKPNCKPGRRMGVAIATGSKIEDAITRATNAANKINIINLNKY